MRISDWSSDVCSSDLLGMSFQRPPALEGVTVEAFTAAIGSSALLESEASALDFNGFAERDVNAGFSGGEIKRWEILKLLLKRPDLSLFDEPESGVDQIGRGS